MLSKAQRVKKNLEDERIDVTGRAQGYYCREERDLWEGAGEQGRLKEDKWKHRMHENVRMKHTNLYDNFIKLIK